MFPVLFKLQCQRLPPQRKAVAFWGEVPRSFHSVQYSVNNDVSMNAFSSDSPMAGKEVIAKGKRYNNKNNSSYVITCKIYLFMIVSYSNQNARKCMIFYF